MKKYEAICISYANLGEAAVYIAKIGVTKEQIMAGDDTGVICQVLDTALTDTLLSALNGPDDTVDPKENP